MLLPVEMWKTEHIGAGLLEAFKEMGCSDKETEGHLPKTIYSDNEGGLVWKDMHNLFKEKGIRHLTTTGHAPVAERTIKAIKALYYKRMDERRTEMDWEATRRYPKLAKGDTVRLFHKKDKNEK